MQDNNLLFFLAVGGLALVCLIALGFLFWVVARLAKGPIFAFFGLLARNADEVTDDDESSRAPRSPRPNLRALAQQQDFDTALAAQQMREGDLPSDLTPRPAARQSPLGTEQHPRVDLNATARSADERLPPSLRSGRRRSNTRRDRADSEDEIFGGMLDLDGDGDPDL